MSLPLVPHLGPDRFQAVFGSSPLIAIPMIGMEVYLNVNGIHFSQRKKFFLGQICTFSSVDALMLVTWTTLPPWSLQNLLLMLLGPIKPEFSVSPT